MGKLMYITALFLFLPVAAVAQDVSGKDGSGIDTRKIVEYLAGDNLAGRFPGTGGDTLAAVFISEKFRELGLEVSLRPFYLKKDSCTTFNVVGVTKGSFDRYIIIGAHYDHLGYGGKGSGSRTPDTLAVHNGADDNASGVAAMLKTAENSLKRNQKTGLVFVAFGAEERGVAGSKEIAENPPVNREKIMAMFNFDMVGYLRDGAITLGGTGTAAELDSLIDISVTEFNTGDVKTPVRVKKSKEGVGPSDHTSFYAKNIPVVYFSTGATLDYHTPEDDAWKLNYNGIDSVAAFATVLLNTISEQPRLTFTEAGSPDAAPMRASFKVTLGLMPDVTGQTENGLRADVVIKGKPAHNAGLKNGDIIIRINETPVTDIESYMKCLGTLKAGEIAAVKVLRGKETILFEVQL